jgi:hypothetical protein
MEYFSLLSITSTYDFPTECRYGCLEMMQISLVVPNNYPA